VGIYDGRRNAVIVSCDPELDKPVQRLRVELPGWHPSLSTTLKQKKQGISFDIPSPQETTLRLLALLAKLLSH